MRDDQITDINNGLNYNEKWKDNTNLGGEDADDSNTKSKALS